MANRNGIWRLERCEYLTVEPVEKKEQRKWATTRNTPRIRDVIFVFIARRRTASAHIRCRRHGLLAAATNVWEPQGAGAGEHTLYQRPCEKSRGSADTCTPCLAAACSPPPPGPPSAPSPRPPRNRAQPSAGKQPHTRVAAGVDGIAAGTSGDAAPMGARVRDP